MQCAAKIYIGRYRSSQGGSQSTVECVSCTTKRGLLQDAGGSTVDKTVGDIILRTEIWDWDGWLEAMALCFLVAWKRLGSTEVNKIRIGGAGKLTTLAESWLAQR